MVPPPNNPGDEFPDFDSMTFEQQMAWLESLAKRQGARQEELTTAADLEIPVPDNPVIDEPGYVPYSIREQSGSAAARSEAPKPEPPVSTPPPARIEPRPPAPAPPPEPALRPAPVGADEMADPMRWLDSLSAQPGESMGEFEFLSELGAVEEIAEPLEAIEPEFDLLSSLEIPAQPERAAASPEDIDPMADPMRWLESLARRQGVSQDQLTTSADLEIPEVSPDTVIDEPGYVPFDITGGQRSAAASKPEPVPEPVPPSPEPEPHIEWETIEETFADLGLPDLSTPGITEIELPDLGEEMEPALEFDVLDMSPEPAAEFAAEAELMDGSLSWLQDLVAEPGAGLASIFGEVELETPPPEVPVPPQPTREAEPVDPLAGMTDEAIAYAQAHGQLTGEQELLWLQRQAAKLAEVHQEQPESFEMEFVEEIAPAEPSELPDWLAQMRDEEEAQPISLEPSFALEEESLSLAEEAGLPGWLQESAPGDAIDLTDVDVLWPEPEVPEAPPAAETTVTPAEVAAYLPGDEGEMSDFLAVALDNEFDRRQVGDESEPSWYTEAVAQGLTRPAAGRGEDAFARAEPQSVEEQPVLEPATAVDIPDWLQQAALESETAPSESMPDWLAGGRAEVPVTASSDELPDWLAGIGEPATEAVDFPTKTVTNWFMEEQTPPPVVQAPPVPAPVAPPKPPVVEAPPSAAVAPEITPRQATPIPQGALFATYRQRLEANPNDYTSRLALARALHTNHEIAASLDQYEVLVEGSQLLTDVSDDLANLAQAQSQEPRVFRLLGDSYMRRGMLQDALDAYRQALDRL